MINATKETVNPIIFRQLEKVAFVNFITVFRFNYSLPIAFTGFSREIRKAFKNTTINITASRQRADRIKIHGERGIFCENCSIHLEAMKYDTTHINVNSITIN